MILTVKRAVLGELKRIQRVADLMGDFQEAPEGWIEKKRRGSHCYYYLCVTKNGTRRRVYLGKERSAELKKAVSLMYRHRKRKVLRHNMEVLRAAADNLWDDSVAGIYRSLSKNCRTACGEGFLDARMEELKSWAAADYPRNTIPYPGAANYAVDGTRVRSKGEELWYNLLTAAGIPFRYDCVITVTDENGAEWELSPDFLIKCYDGTMIIIEHVGKLKNEKYRHDLSTKIYLYQQAGFVLGNNLFLTSDDAEYGTNSEMIARKLQEIEQMFYGAA